MRMRAMMKILMIFQIWKKAKLSATLELVNLETRIMPVKTTIISLCFLFIIISFHLWKSFIWLCTGGNKLMRFAIC